ncbi:hypothetical protein SUGI_1132920 [Cryptomeria japonica]|nr:hypothetical protein SUGI_1132920 [Cryptomeria japonica]
MSGYVVDRIPLGRPWVMISVNNGTDFHFRKAQFDPGDCPIDCSRPCERVCPASASTFESSIHYNDVPLNASSISKFPVFPKAGVINERCYGCGRCLPVCPYGKIRENTYVRTNAAITKLLMRSDVGAIEIHTSVGFEFHVFNHGAIPMILQSLAFAKDPAGRGDEERVAETFLPAKDLPAAWLWSIAGP